MRIVFMGSSRFACSSLETLLLTPGMDVALVVTQPDRPQGRKLQVAGCPVKQYLSGRNIPVLAPVNINTPESLQQVREADPDVIAVVAYGQLLKAPLLAIPRMGCVNVHGSLLPKYRGAAPVQWAIAQGESVTGVTTLFMNERMDAGDMILRREAPIGPEDTGGGLLDVLGRTGAELLRETLRLLRAGEAPRIPQEEDQATFAPRLTRADGVLDWSRPAVVLGNRVRGFHPWPGCSCEIPAGSGAKVKILRARPEASEGGAPGTIMDVGRSGILVQAGPGTGLRLVEVQPEGRTPMSGEAFARGRRIGTGMRAG